MTLRKMATGQAGLSGRFSGSLTRPGVYLSDQFNLGTKVIEG